MDLVKIGSYIASKRKALGMTQVQLADRLGMSDKSVSKWERGICLPDVSLYMELCGVLGISINEFLAGEDLIKEDIPKQSEENIINIARIGQRKYSKLQRIFIILSVIYFLLACGMVLWKTAPGLSYVGPAGDLSQEKILAENIFTGKDVMLFNYRTDNSHEKIDLILYGYEDGHLKDMTIIDSFDMSGRNLRQGAVMAVADHDAFRLTVMAASKRSGRSPETIEILNDVEGAGTLRHDVVMMKENVHIRPGMETILAYVAYSEGDDFHVVPLEAIGSEKIESGKGYLYALSFRVGWA